MYSSLKGCVMTASIDPAISVSIVCMNNVSYLRRCLESLYRYHEGRDIEVLVVFYRTSAENIDRITTEFPQIEAVISSDDETRGYGENQNLGLRRARGKYSVILNDDVVFEDAALYSLRAYHKDHPGVGALLPKLLNEDGSVQLGIRGRLTPLSFALLRLRLNPVLERVGLFRSMLFDSPRNDADEPVPADCGSGAFFWIRTDLLRSIGYMDERFFLAPDDIDLSMRVTATGATMIYVPGVQVIHTGSTTLTKMFSKVLPVSIFGTTDLFRSHYGRRVAAAATALNAALSLASVVYWGGRWLRGDREKGTTMLRAHVNVARFTLFRPASTKEIFLRAW
jgi:GT2 family glycosyltransferase